MIPLLLSTVVALAAPAAEAPPAAPDAPSITLEHYELDNGLDVVLAPDASDPVVAVNVWYHVGSGDEAEGLSGFAHLFEHLMFQGSPSNPDEYFGPLEAVGGRVNGSTTADRTNYFEVLPAEQLPLALFLESDRMGWLLESLDQERLDNQREVVRNERRQRYEDRPYGDAWMTLDAAMHPAGHPYHHPTIGSHEDLENATLEDVKAFFRQHYAPNNAALVVAGSFEPEEAKRLVAAYFGDIPAGEPVTHPSPAPIRLPTTVEVRKYQDVAEQRLWMAWPGPPAFAEDEAELDLLADVLSGGRESRLDQALVHQGGLASSVTAFVDSRRFGSKLVVMATPAEGHTTDELVAEVERVVRELVTEAPPTEAEIEAARAQIERRRYQRLVRVGNRADLLNGYLFYLGQPDGLAADLARYDGVTPEHLQEVARTWLDAPRVELHVWPEEVVAATNEAPGFWRRLFRKRDTGSDDTPPGEEEAASGGEDDPEDQAQSAPTTDVKEES